MLPELRINFPRTVLTAMAGFKTPRLRSRLIYPVRRCDCGRPALYRLRVRQYDAGLLRPHHASLYLCERCYRSELEACDLSGAHLPIVTLLGPPHKHPAD
jgi:hypothetical protein